jgi:hypothetical protein
MAWIESKSRLNGHPSLFALARTLGVSRPQALGHLILLWNGTAIFQGEDVAGLSAEYVAEIAEWVGDPHPFYDALVRTGWITQGGDLNFQDCAHIVYGTTPRTSKHSWRVLRLKILNRDEFTCHYCGSKNPLMAVDHVIPVTKGGTDEESNLVAACQTCNSKKNNKPLKEFLDALSKS